ncbi:MAG: hypothetical protein M0Z41_10290 [Peptococcaceae bacterium]|nr:hypothetical protein [Peptococcaceae bacterium]
MGTIVLLSIRETFRKKIFVLAVVFAVVYGVLFGLGLHAVAGATSSPMQKLVKSLIMSRLLSVGLYFGGLLTGFLSIITCAGSISADIESGIMHSVLARPVRRAHVVLGRFAGLAVVLVAFAAFLFLEIAFVVKYIAGFSPSGLVPALLIFPLQPLVLASLAIWGSTVMNTVANGVVVFMLYLLAIVGGMVEQFGALLGSSNMVNTGIVTSLVLPADVIYRKVAAIILGSGGPVADNPLGNLGPFGSRSEPSVWMMVYVFLYIGFMLFRAVRSFGRRDV